jgi:hypothetical protein
MPYLASGRFSGLGWAAAAARGRVLRKGGIVYVAKRGSSTLNSRWIQCEGQILLLEDIASMQLDRECLGGKMSASNPEQVQRELPVVEKNPRRTTRRIDAALSLALNPLTKLSPKKRVNFLLFPSANSWVIQI